MRTIFIMILLFLMTGCGTVTSVKVGTLQVEQPSFRFLDNRTNEMRESHVDLDSSGVTTFYADDNIFPSPPTLIASALQTELRDKLAGHTIILNEFIMYVYEHTAPVNKDQLHTAVASTSGGYAAESIAGMLIPSIDKIVGEKTVYLRISGKIDDQEFSTFVGDLYRGRVTEANIQTTLKKTLAQLVIEVQRGVNKK